MSVVQRSEPASPVNRYRAVVPNGMVTDPTETARIVAATTNAASAVTVTAVRFTAVDGRR